MGDWHTRKTTLSRRAHISHYLGLHAAFQRLNSSTNVAVVENEMEGLGLRVPPVLRESWLMFVWEENATSKGLSHQQILTKSAAALT